jgi:thiol:disulfide interchange protein
MDKTTLKAEAVTKALEGYVKVKVQAEDPDQPATKALMKRLGAVGLPAYAILRPRL